LSIARTTAVWYFESFPKCDAIGKFSAIIMVMIMIFYCGLVVHITDTRAQKVVRYTSVHITETVFAHDQH